MINIDKLVNKMESEKPAAPPTQVFLIEDDHALGAALCEYLEMAGFGVQWVCSGLEFYARIADAPDFQVAIVDIGLPDQSGLVLAEYIRGNTHASVIVLTANDSVERTAESYRLGVDLFMAKPVDSDVLVAAVASMALRYRQRAGEAGETPPAMQPLVSSGTTNTAPKQTEMTSSPWYIDCRRRQLITPKGMVIKLTRQELTLCEMMAVQPDHRVTRGAELQRLYGRDDESAQRALDTLISRLRRKLSAAIDGPPPILTDYGIGHSFSDTLTVIENNR